MSVHQKRRVTKASVNIVNFNRNGKLIAVYPITNTVTAGTLEFREGSVGSGFTATFTETGGVIDSVTVTAGGSNYSPSNPPSVDGDAGGNADAVLTPVIVDGVVTSVTIEDGGTGYTTGSCVIANVAGSLVYEVGAESVEHRDLNLPFRKGLYVNDNSITGDYIGNVLID